MEKLLSLSFFIFLLSGCVSTQEWLSTKPQNFQDGYLSGCDNGKDMARYSYIDKQNNTEKYKNDKLYKEAWDEGYDDCYSDMEFDIMTRTRFGE